MYISRADAERSVSMRRERISISWNRICDIFVFIFTWVAISLAKICNFFVRNVKEQFSKCQLRIHLGWHFFASTQLQKRRCKLHESFMSYGNHNKENLMSLCNYEQFTKKFFLHATKWTVDGKLVWKIDYIYIQSLEVDIKSSENRG